MHERIESSKVIAHLLPETESYGMVVDASVQGILAAGEEPQARTAAILKTKCECLRAGALVGGFTLIDACSALAKSSMQWYDTYPEDCWLDIEAHIDNDCLFELVFGWLVKELKDWSKQRLLGVLPTEPCDSTLEVRNALLSILCVMMERKRDEFVLLAANLEQQGVRLSTLLAEAAVHHRKIRARMAAITLLSRLPNLDADEIAEVVRVALGDDEGMRNRALMLLPHFRELNVTSAFLDDALARLSGNEPASIVLAYANLLTNLVNANRVEKAGKRREIMNALRNAASDTRNIRMLSHLSGLGTGKSPRKVVNDGRLDQALLAVMAKSYSNFFKYV